MPAAQNPDPAADSPDSSPRRRTAVILLAVEALLLAAAAVYCASLAGAGEVTARFGLGLAVFLGLFAIAVAVAAHSLRRGGRFGIGFGITWQMFQALVGASMLRGAMYWQGALALGLAIALFVMLTTLSKAEHERSLRAE